MSLEEQPCGQLFVDLHYNHTVLRKSGIIAERTLDPMRKTISTDFLYFARPLENGDELLLQVIDVDNNDASVSLLFGVTTCPLSTIKALANTHKLRECGENICGGRSSSLEVRNANTPGDVIVFTRKHDGSITYRVNDLKEVEFRCTKHCRGRTELIAFVKLIGAVKKVHIAGRLTMSQKEDVFSSKLTNYGPEDVDLAFHNVLAGQITLTWTSTEPGIVLNRRLFEPGHKTGLLMVRDVLIAASPNSIEFGLAPPEVLSSVPLHEVPGHANTLRHTNILRDPKVGDKFVITRTEKGKVRIAAHLKTRTLFRVRNQDKYFPFLVFSGTVTSLEWIPNDRKVLTDKLRGWL